MIEEPSFYETLKNQKSLMTSSTNNKTNFSNNLMDEGYKMVIYN